MNTEIKNMTRRELEDEMESYDWSSKDFEDNDLKKFNITYNEKNYIVVVNENKELEIKPIYESLNSQDLGEMQEALRKAKLELKEIISLN